MIDRGDAVDSVALDQDNEAGVGRSERQVGVLLDEIRDPRPVLSAEWFHHEVPRCDGANERCLGCWSELTVDQVTGLGDHEWRRTEGSSLTFEQLATRLMVGIALVCRGEQHARVDDEHSTSAESLGQHLVGIAGPTT